MTAIMIHEGRSREIDALGAATKLNRLANRPEILANLHPGADTLDLTPLALAPHTFIALRRPQRRAVLPAWSRNAVGGAFPVRDAARKSRSGHGAVVLLGPV